MQKKVALPLMFFCLFIGFDLGINVEKNLYNLGPLKTVWTEVNNRFINRDTLDYKKMAYDAVKGMVNGLGDRHTRFLDPEEVKKLGSRNDYVGIGIRADKKNNEFVILGVIDNSPAAKLGLKAGDTITQVDGKPIADLPQEEIIKLIRGERGSSVTITTVSKDKSLSSNYNIKREQIKIPDLRWAMVGNTAFLKISHFSEKTYDEFLQAGLEILEKSPDGLIIDLRGNPGGLLEITVNMAGEFFKDRVNIMTERETKKGPHKWFSGGNGIFSKMPVVILVDKNSASASEVFAGAMQDYKRATLVGEKTYGKGSVQQQIPINDGSMLIVTMAKWFTPNDRSIQDRGLDPDVTIEISDQDIISGKVTWQEPGKDPQLDKALEILNKK